MLSLKVKYAIRALTALAQHDSDGPLQTSALVEAAGAPRPYLENILTELKRHGFVDSVRGRAGGFRLSRAPDQITYAEIIRALDGPLALAPCASVTAYRRCADCRDEATCTIRRALVAVRDATAAVLESTTLADSARSEEGLLAS
jgi:Rrf2 family protein